MSKFLAVTISVLMLAGCSVGKQKNGQATNQGVPPLASAQVPVRTALPSPIASAAPDKQSEPRAEVVPLPADTEVDSTASNNATQQSATAAVSAQVGKFAESVDASLVKLDSKITAQNEMIASFRAEVSANAIANLRAEMRADFKAELQALGQAGVGNTQTTEHTSVGGDLVTQFSDGMERFMSRMLEVVSYAVSAIKWIVGGAVLSCVGMIGSNLKVCVDLIKFLERSRSKDDERQDRILRDVVLKGGAK